MRMSAAYYYFRGASFDDGKILGLDIMIALFAIDFD